MKIKKLMFALFGVLNIAATGIDIPIIDGKPIYNSDGYLSKMTGEENLTLNLKYTKPSGGLYSVNTLIYNAANDSLLYSKSYNAMSSQTNRKITVDFPIKNRLKSDGLRIEFDYCMRTNTPYQTSSGVIYPYQKQYINVAAYRREPFICRGNYFAVGDNEIYTDEEYDFSNLNEYLSVSQNSKIDLSNIKFKYTAYGDYSCDKAILYIKDYNNVFPNLRKVDGVIPLSMKYIQNEDEISLEFDETLYVNLDTLDMSSTMMANYVETDSIFVPINKESILSGDDIYILLENSGYSEVNFTIPFDFYYSKKYIGECYESDYCIHGGVKE